MGLTHAMCKRQNGVDGFIALYYYNPVLKKIIKSIKYRLVKEGLIEFLKITNSSGFEKILFYKNIDNSLRLQPIPLHAKRLKARGFNQSKIIVEYITSALQIKQIDILIREKETAAQAQLADKKSRFNNIQGAFTINKNSTQNNSNTTILLVDDVVTSGSTVKEAARVLKRGGSEKVYVFSLAKG